MKRVISLTPAIKPRRDKGPDARITKLALASFEHHTSQLPRLINGQLVVKITIQTPTYYPHNPN